MKYKTIYQRVSEIQNSPIHKAEKSGTWLFKDSYIFDYFDKFDRNIKILDLGCHSGYFLNKLYEMGFKNLYAIDIADFATKKNYNLNIVNINKENFPFANESFDVVTAFQVLEHVENYFHLMHEAHRVLKKDRLFIFSVPNHLNIFNRLKFALTGNITSWNVYNNHLLFLTRDVFKKTYLNKFDLVGTYYDRGGVPFWGRLNKLPFVKVAYKKLILPRSEFFGFNVCYFLKKISQENK